MTKPCPCGTGRDFAACCGPLLSHDKDAPTAEALMRSRYTAFVENDMAYLAATQDPRRHADFDQEATGDWNKDVTWTGLSIVGTGDGLEGDSAGTVEFVATYEKDGEKKDIHEESRFKKKGGRWVYMEGRQRGSTVKAGAEGDAGKAKVKVGRNEVCPCGSGKKYKKCCGG